MDQVITADDVIRAGACSSGVGTVVRRLGTRIAAAMPVSKLLPLLKEDERGYALRAAAGDGYGYGYGYGDGDGDGDGYGDGYGDGRAYL